MDQKAVKNFLPSTYQQFLAIKKKQISKVTMPSTTNLKERGTIQQAQSVQTKVGKCQLTEQSEQQTEYKQGSQIKIRQRLINSDFQKMFDDFLGSKFDMIKGKIEQQLIKLQQQRPIQTVSANRIMKELGIQSFQNIVRLQKQFNRPVNKRNVDAIDNMLSFNKFFVILDRDKRYKIYDNAIFQIYQENTTIYEQNDVDDFMFVIIKGCVKQYEKRSTSYNQKMSVNFTSYYQGSNFGDSLIVNEEGSKNKRYAHTIAAEKTFTLKILNSYYRELITNSKEDDFQKKINALLATVIFKDISKIVIMPLVSTIERIELDYGKVLIKQGEPVKKMYFIASGNLQVIYVDRSKRNIKHLNIQDKPQNLYIKRPQTQARGRKYNSFHNTFYYQKNKEQSKKQFLLGKKQLHGDQLQYNDHVLFSDMRIGDFLGGKSFLPQSQIERKLKIDQTFDPSLQAKLTVVSSSILTVVYALDEKKFFSLSDNLQKVIVEGILRNAYFDQHNIDSKVSGQRQWKKYSQKLVQDVIKNKKSRNHSFRH